MSFVVVVASIVGALIHLTIKRLKDRAPIINTFLLHALVFNVDFLEFFFGFIPHVRPSSDDLRLSFVSQSPPRKELSGFSRLCFRQVARHDGGHDGLDRNRSA